jgi:chemotaxis protein CheD
MSNASPWAIAPPRVELVVGVADMITSNDPAAEIITHSLGSCLGVVIYDPLRKVGGLLHFMLPDSTIDPIKAVKTPFMFADTGLPRLFRAVYGLGGEKSRLQVKVAGGAEFLDDQRLFNIGPRNVIALRNILTRNGVCPAAMDVGGQISRTVRLNLSNGQVSIRTPGRNSSLI